MSQFNFKGDLEGASSEQLEFISNVLEKRELNDLDVIFEPVGTAGDNYIGNVKRITVTKNGTSFKMIAKLAPNNEIMRELGNVAILFRNEHVIYTEILPRFREFQISAEVPEEEWFRFAECYGSNGEAPHEVILFEDLKEDGFLMLDRFQPLTNDCVKIVLKNFAVYHSLSYVLKYREPETFRDLKLKLEDAYSKLESRDESKFFTQQIEQAALAVLQDERQKKLIKETVNDLFILAKKNRNADTDAKHSIIQQGDGWTNNILFKMENGTPLNCALIDYQMAKESSPVFDIMYMLFNSTSHEQRQKNYHNFIDYYHSEMDKSLHNYGLKAAFVYPRDQLDADMKRYAKFMLVNSVLVSTLTTKKTEDATKLKDTIKNSTLEDVASGETMNDAMAMEDEETMLLFKSRIEGVMDSFLEFGLLQVL